MSAKKLPHGMGMGNMGNMGNMIKQAQKLQQDMLRVQKELEEKTFEVTAGGGAVTVSINGRKELLGIILKPDIVDPGDVEMLQDLIVAAVNEAIRMVDESTKDALSPYTGGMGLPGLF